MSFLYYTETDICLSRFQVKYLQFYQYIDLSLKLCTKIISYINCFYHRLLSTRGIMVSSACYSVLISFSIGILTKTFIPLHDFIFSARISATNKKSNAEIGQPCLMPFSFWHFSEIYSLTLFLILKNGFHKLFLHIFKKLFPKLNLSRTSNIKFHSIE